MRVVITDLVPAGTCEMSEKENVECVVVKLDDGAADVCVAPAELLKLLRFKRKQEPIVPKPPEKKGTTP